MPRMTSCLQAMQRAKGARLHLIGLLSDGGVHSHNTHLYALLEMAAKLGLENVYVHAVLDGRDVPPRSALTYFQELEEKFQQIGTGKVATLSGRYYTMDRDKRWERVEKAYRCLTDGEGLQASTAREAVENGYKRGENDEFLQPTLVDREGLVQDGDSIIFFNFRPDRAREITRAFVDKDFSGLCHKADTGFLHLHDPVRRHTKRAHCLSGAKPGRHSRPGDKPRRPAATAHSRDGEICSCHLLL